MHVMSHAITAGSAWGFWEGRHLAARLLASSLAREASSRCILNRFSDELVTRLAAEDCRAHENPELFLNIAKARLVKTGKSWSELESVLRVHCGLEPPEALLRGRDGLYRLIRVNGTATEVRNGGLQASPDVCWSVARERTILITPDAGFFSDVLPQIARGDVLRRDSREPCKTSVLQCLDIIEQYSPALLQDMLAAVAYIVVLKQTGDSKRSSFSCGLDYYGAVFIAASGGVETLIEGLIHEYCHQRLWSWYYFETRNGAELPVGEIVSPVTGRSRPAYIMLQALIIYLEICRFLEWYGSRTVKAANQRLSILTAAVTYLYSALQSTMGEKNSPFRVALEACRSWM